ncbi:unnamed protein product [Penicillium salamii]|nr:unnamed protein product [Penicillium salamii]CAG8387875.1 unnamed protein product [Penicillium salamii]
MPSTALVDQTDPEQVDRSSSTQSPPKDAERSADQAASNTFRPLRGSLSAHQCSLETPGPSNAHAFDSPATHTPALVTAPAWAPVSGSLDNARATDSFRSLGNPSVTEPDGADSMNGVTGNPSRTPEVFGSSSAGSFMRRIQSVIKARLGEMHPDLPSKEDPTMQQSRDSSLKISSLGYKEAGLLLLPPRSLADSLMQAYWDNDWSLYPIIDRANIQASYDALWRSHSENDTPVMSVCVINVCFAIGCHYNALIPPSERKIAGEDFFVRAEALYKKTGEAFSCERVQCLLLIGLYLQSTTSVSKCWMTVGQAIRMAQSLGIHIRHNDARETVSQREYRYRTWHGCIWLDRVLSSTLGRPGMIPSWLFNSIPLPSMIDDEFFPTQTESSSLRPDGRPCRMAFVVKAMELYHILDEILVELYLKAIPREDPESKLSNILRIDSRLQAWKISLPRHLYPHCACEDDKIIKRQAVVLRVRFLHARILLYRPTVISYCMHGAALTADCAAENDSSFASDECSLPEKMMSQCARTSFDLAHDLIEIFDQHLHLETLLGPLPNWWYSVLYLYNATMMILVERFLESKKVTPDALESKAERTWHKALRILRSYGSIADSALRCIAVLEIFSERLFPASHQRSDNDIGGIDAASTNTAQYNPADCDWDLLWTMSSSFGQNSSLSDSNLFPCTFDDFYLTDLLSVPPGEFSSRNT